jgi:hypothetical protein
MRLGALDRIQEFSNWIGAGHPGIICRFRPVSILQRSSPNGHDFVARPPVSFPLEGEMRNVIRVVFIAAMLMSAACVPAYGPAGMPMMPVAPYHPPVYGPMMPVPSQSAPRGGWDNVMMLPAGAALDVLTADGRRTAGSFVAATNTWVRVQLAGGTETEIGAADVIRIDRWLGGPAGAQSVARDAAKGALVGAGAMGVLGLLVGHVPPARAFAAGALASAYQHEEMGRVYRRSVIVYLAAQSR